MAVARKQVVVVALEEVAAADVERRRLAAQPGPALVDVADVALRGQPIRRHKPRHARAQHRDAHQARTAARIRATPPKRPAEAASPISVIGTAMTKRSSSRNDSADSVCPSACSPKTIAASNVPT